MNTDKIYAEHLANEYAPKDDSKVIALRKLDARAKLPATVVTYTFGILSALVTGVGMCLSMRVIGSGSSAMSVLLCRKRTFENLLSLQQRFLLFFSVKGS